MTTFKHSLKKNIKQTKKKKHQKRKKKTKKKNTKTNQKNKTKQKQNNTNIYKHNSQTHTNTHNTHTHNTHTISHTHTHTHTLYTLSLTHTHTHTLSHTLTHTLSHTHTHTHHTHTQRVSCGVTDWKEGGLESPMPPVLSGGGGRSAWESAHTEPHQSHESRLQTPAVQTHTQRNNGISLSTAKEVKLSLPHLWHDRQCTPLYTTVQNFGSVK